LDDRWIAGLRIMQEKEYIKKTTAMTEKQSIRIVGVLITDRKKAAVKVQETLTRYGCSIKTRLGLHEATDDLCSPNGLILLELTGPAGDMDSLEKALNAIDGVHVRTMQFD